MLFFVQCNPLLTCQCRCCCRCRQKKERRLHRSPNRKAHCIGDCGSGIGDICIYQGYRIDNRDSGNSRCCELENGGSPDRDRSAGTLSLIDLKTEGLCDGLNLKLKLTSSGRYRCIVVSPGSASASCSKTEVVYETETERCALKFFVFFFFFCFFGLLAIDSQFRGAHWFWSTTTGAPFGRSSAPFPFVSSAYITPPKMPPSDIFFPLLLGGQTQILLTAPVGSQGSRSEKRGSEIGNRESEPLSRWWFGTRVNKRSTSALTLKWSE